MQVQSSKFNYKANAWSLPVVKTTVDVVPGTNNVENHGLVVDTSATLEGVVVVKIVFLELQYHVLDNYYNSRNYIDQKHLLLVYHRVSLGCYTVAIFTKDNRKQDCSQLNRKCLYLRLYCTLN